jgi:hypothetical protein
LGWTRWDSWIGNNEELFACARSQYVWKFSSDETSAPKSEMERIGGVEARKERMSLLISIFVYQFQKEEKNVLICVVEQVKMSLTTDLAQV